MTQGHKCATVNTTGCGVRFLRKKMKYLIFSFPRFGNEVERGDEFHSTHNASRIRKKMGTVVS